MVEILTEKGGDIELQFDYRRTGIELIKEGSLYLVAAGLGAGAIGEAASFLAEKRQSKLLGRWGIGLRFFGLGAGLLGVMGIDLGNDLLRRLDDQKRAAMLARGLLRGKTTED